MNLVMAAGQRIVQRLLPFATELLAIKAALELAVERRLIHVVIESDCTEGVRIINGTEVCLAADRGRDC